MDEAEVKMAYTSGELAHSKTRLDVIKQQELLIREEAKEREMVRGGGRYGGRGLRYTSQLVCMSLLMV